MDFTGVGPGRAPITANRPHSHTTRPPPQHDNQHQYHFNLHRIKIHSLSTHNRKDQHPNIHSTRATRSATRPTRSQLMRHSTDMTRTHSHSHPLLSPPQPRQMRTTTSTRSTLTRSSLRSRRPLDQSYRGNGQARTMTTTSMPARHCSPPLRLRHQTDLALSPCPDTAACSLLPHLPTLHHAHQGDPLPLLARN